MQPTVVDLDESPPDSPPDATDAPGAPAASTTESTEPAEPAEAVRVDFQRPPVRDFALAAFQREEDLPRLVAALEEHDSPLASMRRAFVGRHISEFQIGRLPSRPGLALVRSDTDGSDTTVKPLKRDDADEAGSGSSTEKDEPGRSIAERLIGLGARRINAGELAAAARQAAQRQKQEPEPEPEPGQQPDPEPEPSKKKNKKKNKKKKKKSGATATGPEDKKEDEEEAEVEKLLTAEGAEALKADIELDAKVDEDTAAGEETADETALTPEIGVDIELGGQAATPETQPAARKLEPVNEEDEAGDDEEADVGDMTASTIDKAMLVTPESESAPLPSPEQIDNAIDQAEQADSEEKPIMPEIVVRIPSPANSSSPEGEQTEDTAVNADALPADEAQVSEEEGQTSTDQGEIAAAASESPAGAEGREEDPQPPTTSPAEPTEPPTTLPSQEAPAQQPQRAPQPPVIVQSAPPAPSYIDHSRPYHLGRSWTLFHSYTGTATRTPSPLAGIMPQPPNPLSGADYSHGLMKLYTASTIEDQLGTWKALRRRIAQRRGRQIEPQGHPIEPGTHGLGIGSLPDDTNFHFFIEHVQPMWEDEACKRGGKIMITGNAEDMDDLFFELMLVLIGEAFVHAAPTPANMTCTVVGAVLSKRRSTCRIEVWLGGREPLNAEWVKQVEKFVRDSFPRQNIFEYKAFHPSRPANRPRDRNGHGQRSSSAGSSAFGRGLGHSIGPGGR